jgi:hypothetical protein
VDYAKRIQEAVNRNIQVEDLRGHGRKEISEISCIQTVFIIKGLGNGWYYG